MDYIALLIGLVAGIFSGLIGIGGGIIMIPALAFILGMGQHTAQGTTLAAMVLPIGLLAAMEYYKSGHVNIFVALLLAAGFISGGYIGAKVAVGISEMVLRKIFGFTLLFLAAKMILGK